MWRIRVVWHHKLVCIAMTRCLNADDSGTLEIAELMELVYRGKEDSCPLDMQWSGLNTEPLGAFERFCFPTTCRGTWTASSDV